MKLILLIPLSLILTGCASYTHTRTSPDGITETTRVGSLFMTGKASKLTSYVKDGDYTRRIGLGMLEGQGDAEFLRALYEAGVAAGKKSVAP